MNDDNWEWLRQAAAQHMAEYAKQFTGPGPDTEDPASGAKPQAGTGNPDTIGRGGPKCGTPH